MSKALRITKAIILQTVYSIHFIKTVENQFSQKSSLSVKSEHDMCFYLLVKQV